MRKLLPLSTAHAGLAAALHEPVFRNGWDEAAFGALLGQPGVFGFVAADDGAEPEGFILVRAAADEAEILTLAVRASARRRGAGRALLQGAIRACREAGIARLFLEVGVGNAAAQALYQNAGFTRTATRVGYYPKGQMQKENGAPEDAAVMVLALD